MPTNHSAINYKWDKCSCHPHHMGHWFHEDLLCTGCGINWFKHQQLQELCPKDQKYVVTRSQNITKQNRNIFPKYRVHWNSHIKNWSLILKGQKQDQFRTAIATNVEFIVSKATQNRSIKEGKKHVHAWAQMDQTNIELNPREASPTLLPEAQISYNFKRCSDFHRTSTNEPIFQVPVLYFSPDGFLFELPSTNPESD
jgi:hypothetical protein